jgi:hypothetical protein
MRRCTVRRLRPFGVDTLRGIALLCAVLAVIPDAQLLAQNQAQQQQGQASEPSVKTLPPEQLDSLLGRGGRHGVGLARVGRLWVGLRVGSLH